MAGWDQRTVEEAGRFAGENYTPISDSKANIAARLRSQFAGHAQSIAESELPDSKVWPRVTWVAFVIGAASLVYVFFTANLWLFALCIFFFAVWILTFGLRGERKNSRTALAIKIEELFLERALAEVVRRQVEAEPWTKGGAVLLDGGVDAIMRRLPSKLAKIRGPKPSPQPMGVSHKGAEELAAQWMRFMGDAKARTTRFSADGGIDVESDLHVAQVKNYAGTVGVAAVRELAGVCATDSRKPLFFTSGSYSSGAIEFANRNRVALFVYNAEAGTIQAANSFASMALNGGL